MLLFGSGNSSSPASNEFALEYVNDLSISIDPYKMSQLGMEMGPYSGTMTIKNWSAGSTITFGQTARNMGNPFFDECGGGIFNERNEVVQPNPPAPLRKIHLSSHDPADKELLKNVKIIPIVEAKSVLKYTLTKPVNPLNITESQILESQKTTQTENNLKQNLTH